MVVQPWDGSDFSTVGSFFQIAELVASGCMALRGVAWRCMTSHRCRSCAALRSGSGGFVFPNREIGCTRLRGVAWRCSAAALFASLRPLRSLRSFVLRAEKARPLSLQARCAFVMTNAQRAARNTRWRNANGEMNFRSGDFCSAARCAFVMTKAQRASYVRRRVSRRRRGGRPGRERPGCPGRRLRLCRARGRWRWRARDPRGGKTAATGATLFPGR